MKFIIGILSFLSRGVPTVFAKELETYKDTGVATISSLETLFRNFVQSLVSISAVALFLMFIVGGFSFLFSGGDPKKTEQAKGTLTNAVIGLVVIVSAYLVLRPIVTGKHKKESDCRD